MGFEKRAEELANKTVLTETESRVQALVEDGKTRHEIADKLDMAVSTVDTHKQRIKRRLEEVQGTTEEIDLDEAQLYDRIKNSITTPPLKKIDIAYGVTPEEAIVKIIQQQPAFTPNRKNGYISSKPELMNTKPQHVCEVEVDSDPPQPSGVEPVVYVEHDGLRDGYSRVVIENVWLVVDWTDGPAKVKFRISLVAPTDAIEGDKTIPYGTYRWKAERMSTELQ